MLRGKTESGFEFELDDNVLDDWKLVKYLRNVDKGDSQYIVDVAERLLGEEQCEKLENFIEEKYGKATGTLMTKEIASILKATKEGKNC